MTVDSRTRTAISANLVDFDISNAPPFEAISYRWGDPAKTHHIQLGCRLPRPLRITQSAYDALCAVTPLCGTKYVWIDSICINQEVASEKSQQIPLMGAIYGSASLVTAYIPDPGYAMKVNVHITGLAWSEVLLGASDDKPAFPRWGEFLQQVTSPEGLVMLLRLRMDSGEQPYLIENVVNFLDSKATVPEDKVYALLSISSGPGLDGNELRIRGVILDDVHTCGSPIFDPPEPGTLGDNNAADAAMDAKDPTDPKNMLPIWRTLSAAAQFAQQLIPDKYYMGRMEPSEALCRTLLQDFTVAQQDLDDEPGRVADVMRVLAKLASLDSETLEDVQAVSKSMEGLDMSCCAGILKSLMFRQLATTRKGYLASVPWGTREGDVVCIFQGAPAPCVLRRVEGGEPNCYVFHGEAYVQGWMHGEARDLELEKVWFTLR
ncbi:hypothetical protein NEMBOFW57_008764 [Staphylotrichum longicolle]|uniref:Heterokaryon incompatibility domain-containing protein n=1 Tax=Staphylotrichum longicolle TaxID=669026 RepID=A0AAD4ERW4_9PEZI|nr:hypothetical protein NEMBOFW57_008764 [Staphylotrichum longicolle]